MTSPRPHAFALAALLIVGGLLVGCSSDDSSTDSVATTAAPAEGGADTTTPPDDGPIAVTDGSGTEVELEEPAIRVVALEYVYAEDLLALGVTPVGVADIKGYGTYVTEPALPADVVDVGTRQDPSLESITALAPDLIIGTTFRQEGIRDVLEGDPSDPVATLLFNPYPEDGSHLDEMRTTFETIAAAVGKSAKADEVLQDLDDHLSEQKATLDAAGLAGSPVALAQGGTQNGRVGQRMFTNNAMSIELLGQVGLTNGWTGDDEQYGFSEVDLEGLTALPPETRFLYIAASSDDIYRTTYADNPIWTGLQFVQDDHVYDLGTDTWLFGGPVSAKVFVDRAVDALT